jgi:hypothetical protein
VVAQSALRLVEYAYRLLMQWRRPETPVSFRAVGPKSPMIAGSSNPLFHIGLQSKRRWTDPVSRVQSVCRPVWRIEGGESSVPSKTRDDWGVGPWCREQVLGDDAVLAGGWRRAGVVSSSRKQNFTATAEPLEV